MKSDIDIKVAEGELKRKIGLLSLTCMITGTIIGASAFVIPPIAAGLTGPSVFISQIISAVPIFLALIPYVTLSTSIPTTCASYEYAKLLSPKLALSGILVLILGATVGGIPLITISAAELFQGVIGFSPNLIVPIGFIILTICYILNLLGIKPVGYVQILTVITLIVALLIFGIGGIPSINVENFTPLFPAGITGLIGGSAMLYYLLTGGLFAIEIGEEIKNPKKTLPQALIIGMVLSTSIFLITQITALGVVNWTSLAGNTLIVPAETFLPPTLLGFFTIGGGVLACITSTIIVIVFVGRFFMTVARDGFLPGFLGKINEDFGTPHWGITLTYTISAALILINPPLETLANIFNFGIIFMISLVLIYSFKLPNKHPEIYENAKIKPSPGTLRVTSIAALSLNALFLLLLAKTLRWTFLIFVIAALTGIFLYYLKKN